jgi:glyoxylase-like metal-dependent hydrolase (beta-lactamase superfamily II)
MTDVNIEEEGGPRPIVHEVASALSPYIRRIVADNPGPMTGPGTNTYLVGIDEIAVIDPGPATDAHLDAVAGCGGDRIRWILLTHTHEDHSPGAAALKERTGAEICAFDDREGVPVDRFLADGDTIEATEFRIRAIHTPGHASNHLCYHLEEERTLFTGDHIMDGSTVVIAPPDGDMAAYLESLEKVKIKRLKAIAPGHGHLITDPLERIDEYVEHRLAREAQILDAVRAEGTTTIESLVAAIYPDLIGELVPRARQSVHAHLLKLADEGKVTGDDPEGAWSAA